MGRGSDGPMAVRAVLFDFGGTVVESRPEILPFFQAAARRCGLTVPWAEYLRANEEVWTELWPAASAMIGQRPSFADLVHERALRRVGVEGSVDAMVRAIRDEAVSPRHHRPFPETEEVLTTLRARGLSAHLVSNNVDYLPELLANLGWADRFASVTYSQEISAAKPDPRLFQLALSRAGCAPQEAMFVGDSWEADVVGAQRAGLRPVWVNRSGAPVRAGATTIPDLRGLLRLVE